MRRFQLVNFIPVIAMLLLSCSSDKKPETDSDSQLEEKLAAISFSADMILPSNFPDQDISIVSEPTRITRKEASAKLGKRAPSYLNYLMIGVVRVTYKVDKDTINVEIAQFASSDDAYGFYAQLRPDGVALDSIGSESFFLGSKYKFTKGVYTVSLSLKRISKDPLEAFRKIASSIASQIEVSGRAQPFFLLFPYRGQVPASGKYYSRNFMEIDGFDGVYTVNYLTDSDTLVLFLSMDSDGAKFMKLYKWGESFGKAGSAPSEFDYSSGNSLSFDHPEHGDIVAGIVRKKIAGFIGYDRGTSAQLCSGWVKGLQ